MIRARQILALVLFLFAFVVPASQARQMESYADKVIVIDIGEDSLGSQQSFGYITRVIKKADADGARALVLEFNTPGGLAMQTSDLMMTVLEPLSIPTYAFVNPKAMSAGALIAGACDAIYMAPVSSIGAAGLINSMGEIEEMTRKKLESAFTAFTRSVVKKKGHNPEIFRSMMIPAEEDMQFSDTVILREGELLTLTSEEAISPGPDDKPLLAKGIVKNIEELLTAEQINAEIVKARPTTFEQIALWIAWMSPVLILLGVGGIYLEFKTPGFGIGGIVAIIAFSLFFFGNYIAGNLAGYETAALFVLGICLILVEIFLFPGTLVAAILGVLLIIVSLFGGMINDVALDYIVTSGDWSPGTIASLLVMPLFRLGLGLFGAALLIMAMMRYLPETWLFRRLSNEVVSGGAVDGEAVGISSSLTVGSVGVALTELKPNGKALIDNKTYDVYSRDGIVVKGTPVRVIEKRSFDFVVEKADAPPAGRAGDAETGETA